MALHDLLRSTKRRVDVHILDDPIAIEDRIDAVPMGIVYVDEQEVARVIGNMWQSPESALKVLLQSHR